jgi:superfamily II DNA or RNA helicase
MMKSRDGIIVDECHALAAATRIRLLRMCSNAYWRVGESGTPLDRGDGKSLKVIGALGPIVAEVTAAELIDKGYLAKPTVKVVEYDHEEFASDLWLKVKKIGIQHDNNRNAAVLWAAQQARKPCMLFVDNIEHGQLITKWLQREGLNAEIVFGLSSTTQRAAALKKLARGDLDIIVASPVFDEGVDITCLESVVLAPGGKALISLLQRIGRAMRRTEDKDTFEIWDFADEGHRILKDHAAWRRAAFKKQGHEIVRIRAPTRLLHATKPV